MSDTSSFHLDRRYLPCRLGSTRLAFDVSRLQGIHRSDLVQRNPSSKGPAGWLLEHEVPVIDLGTWLGLEPCLDKPSGGRVLVFDSTPEPTGLLVDSSGSARTVQPGDLYVLPPALMGLGDRGFKGIWVAEDQPWLALDPFAPSTEDSPHSVPATVAPAEVSFPSLPALGATANESRQGGRLLLFSTLQGQGFERPVRFGLSITQILEVTDLPPLNPVPGAPDFVHGLTVWRGEPLVVVNVDRCMGWSCNGQVGDRLLVAQATDGSRLGLAASGTPQLLRLPVPHRPGALSFDEPRVLGVFELERETVILPDLRQLAVPGGP